MTLLSDVRTYLISADTSALDPDRATAIATVRSMVANRMYRNILDEGARLPALTFRLVDNMTGHTLDGQPEGLLHLRLQIDVWGMLGSDVDVLGQAVKDALDGYTQDSMVGTAVNALLWDNELDDFEPDRKQYFKMLDFRIVYQ